MTLHGHRGSVEEGSVTDAYFVKAQRKLVPPVPKLFPGILVRDHHEEISVNSGVLRGRNLRFPIIKGEK
jgi:hypothetical protein